MAKSFQKRLRGKKVTQAEFAAATIDAVRKLSKGDEGARPIDVADVLGDPWTQPDFRQILNQTLVNMERRGTLQKAGRGRYTVNEQKLADRGDRQSDSIEARLIPFLKSVGGFATMRQMMRHLGIDASVLYQDDTDWASDADDVVKKVYIYQRDFSYSVAFNAIKRSELIRKDFPIFQPNPGGKPRRYHHLNADALAALPRTGWFSHELMKWALPGASNASDVDIATDRAFVNIAAAVTTVIRARDVKHADVADELEDAMKLWRPAYLRAAREAGILKPPERARSVAPRAKRTTAEMPVFDGTPLPPQKFGSPRPKREEAYVYPDDLAVFDGTLPEITPGFTLGTTLAAEELFEKFCNGEHWAHMTAPLALYIDLAAILHVDAAALSRGAIEPASFTAQRLKPPIIQDGDEDHDSLDDAIEEDDSDAS